MADYQSVWEGKQIDDGLGRIINGELDKLTAQAASSAQYAQAAERGVKDALANIPEGETPIINDLVTGGARMPLSAEMGKKLQTEKADAAATAAAMSNKVPLTGGTMAGPIYFWDNNAVILRSTEDILDVAIGRASIHFDKSKFVDGGDIRDAICLRDTGSGAEYRIATATPPQEYDLPLAAGVTRARKTYYIKEQNGRVQVHFCVSYQPAGGRTVVLGILPTGYRPAETETDSCTATEAAGDVMGPATVEVLYDGTVQVYANVTGAIGAVGSIEFTATHYGPNALQSQVRMPTARVTRAAIQEQPVDKCMCVVDAEGNYAEFVMVTITHDELGALYTVHYYDIVEGEQLIDAMPPIRRPYAGADGFIRPRWDFDAKVWCEDATAEEIAAWELEHPAPEPVPDVPNETEQLKARVAELEADKAERAELEAMAAAIERGLSV